MPTLCECSGPVRLTADLERCAGCGGEVTMVEAFENGGEWFAVELLEVGAEVGAGQCDSCGSFLEDGSPGDGFVVQAGAGRASRGPAVGSEMRCSCCGDVRAIVWRQHPMVVFA